MTRLFDLFEFSLALALWVICACGAFCLMHPELLR